MSADAKKSKDSEVPDVAASMREFAKSDINKTLTPEDRLQFYRDMLRIRRFEERSIRAYQQGHIGGFLHLYIGQEAVAVGCVSLMTEDDHIITAYRDHGHALAVGMTMNECMAELFGKHTGCSKGKGGSMHFFAPDKNYWGGHGIVAGQTPLGAGIAFALKYKKIKGCCLCFLGDGATNQGPWYESLNLASLWNLPVVFIIENNGFSMGTAMHRHSTGTPLARRAEGYDIDWGTCYGHDVYEVRHNIGEAMERAREKSRPTVLEIITYRYRGHSVADADDTYRTKQDIQDYKDEKDPLNLFKCHLVEEGVADEDALKQINNEAKEEAETSAQFAEQSPFPPVSDIQADVYWETDNPDGKASKGTLFFN
ncbi:MAG: pyruvate dehydrogenase (acetyl-transferring) E1 component subunit alpha [Opitutae bacterium]|nr:pyruvate dehydrogenase (acetyl-transferring) E1 component subunit alpha [Opitutae bacterium]